jgi:hypothetical protein
MPERHESNLEVFKDWLHAYARLLALPLDQTLGLEFDRDQGELRRWRRSLV